MSSNANEADEKVDEYETDPEDKPLPAMRRRDAASDDEEDSDVGEEEDLPPKKNESLMSRSAQSDGESDGQGGAEVYDDDVDDYDEEEYDELGEEFEEELEQVNGNEVLEERRQGELEGENREGNKEENKDEENKEGEKKENEPYAVPTSGAFYMHDDRFQENGRGGGGRRRRMYAGGRKIWNPKDERAWVHDRFEEMTIQEPRHDDDRRRPRGRYRGRGGSGGRGPRRVGGGGDRGGSYPRGGRGSRSYYDDGQNHNKSTRSVRGRGQRRYEPVNRNNPRNQPPQEKQILQRTNEQGSNPSTTTTGTNTRQHSQAQTSNTLSSSLPKKQTFSSSLNSASPPFYPSNSSNSNQDLSSGVRRDTQDNRGKSIAVGSTLAPNSATTTAVRVQGRVVMGTDSQISRVSSQAPTSMAQHRQVSASLQPVSGTSSGLGEDRASSVSPTNKLKPGISASKGKAPGSGQLTYGGAPVIGATGPMSLPHGEQGFPGTSALLPVMQFSGQHHAAPGVGMALPGYVPQSQLGFNNSEMTWVPVLAGAAGSIGGSYGPPYIALDGGYYNNAPPPSSQISSSAPARETGAAKLSDGSKSSQKPEVPTEEPGQRQNKPRRQVLNF
ncbi:protein CASC3-like isoform X2 [Carex littledalei]|uniref:Protein CASC3-like isoform X2 n=1 Tax=Carex littledalei TaxID=544730 RepID=A0A833VM43_9POAL|nr:protein CASC3-like isoform X2 [Carex littledalei]